jgi:hypothetical protein
MSTNKEIREAVERLELATHAANEAASALIGEVLLYNRSIISEATIVRETATLLDHVTQGFRMTHEGHHCARFVEDGGAHDR